MDYEYIPEPHTESIYNSFYRHMQVGCDVLAYVTNAEAVNMQLKETLQRKRG